MKANNIPKSPEMTEALLKFYAAHMDLRAIIHLLSEVAQYPSLPHSPDKRERVRVDGTYKTHSQAIESFSKQAH